MSKQRTTTTAVKPHKDYDIFVRGILSLTQLVEKLLRYALDKNIIRYVNFSTLKPLPDTHIDKRLRISYSDSIHECALNTEELPEEIRHLPNLPQFRFVFIWEAKSKKEALPIDFQIGGYDDNIRRRDFKKEEKKNNILSIVVPILLYHGEEVWEKKRLFDYFKPYLPEELLAYIPQEKFIIIDIQAMSDEHIEKALDLEELRSAFIALKHGHDKEYFRKNLKKIFTFVKSIPTKELLEMYVEMLIEYMQRRSKLEADEFKELVEQSNDQEMGTSVKTIFEVAREEGREKGREEGREEGLILAIKAFIRTTHMTDAVIAKELQVSIDLVKKIRLEIHNTSKP